MVWWNDISGEPDESPVGGKPDPPLAEEEAHLREALARARSLVERGIAEGLHFARFFHSALQDLTKRRSR